MRIFGQGRSSRKVKGRKTMALKEIFVKWWRQSYWQKISFVVLVFWSFILLAPAGMARYYMPNFFGYIALFMVLLAIVSAFFLFGLVINICDQKPHIGWMLLGGAIALVANGVLRDCVCF